MKGLGCDGGAFGVMYYVLLVAVLNLGLGFGVAAYLGRRYRALTEPESEWSVDGSSAFSDLKAPPGETAVTSSTKVAGGLLPEDRTEPVGVAAKEKTTPQAPSEPPSAEAVAPQRPTVLPREKSASEQAVDGLIEGVEQYQGQVTQADDELRAYIETPDAEAIATCLSSLLKATEDYLENRGDAYRHFRDVHQQKPVFDAINDSMQAVVERQDEQIKSTSAAIEAFDYEGDLEDGCRQVVTQTSKLIDENHQLRDALDDAMMEVTRSERRLGEVDAVSRIDELTGLSSRAGLEAELFEWWQKDPHRMRLLGTAMVDVDHFAQLNGQYGHRVGDEVLRSVAQLLAAEARDETVAGRFSGQKFVLLFPDTDSRAATNVVERFRQKVEMTRFQYRESEFRVTVSCAVTEAVSDDTAETVFARGEATLQEAKRYGRNRTFLYEGKYPTPVVPPNFSLEEKQVVL